MPVCAFPQFFPLLCIERSLTAYTNFFILYALSGDFPRVVRPSASWGLAGWKEILRSQNNVRWNGTEERPEWGASPEKPSKPLRFDTESLILSLGLCAESLAGSLRIRSTFQR